MATPRRRPRSRGITDPITRLRQYAALQESRKARSRTTRLLLTTCR